MSSSAPAPLAPTRESTERLFHFAMAGTAVLKLILAAAVPLTGDEAYFVVWGRFLDYGYYDHGAMTGWWIALTPLAGKSVFVLRLPAVVTSLVGALLLRGALRPIDQVKANLAATLFLLSPINLFSVLMTTDTPLLLFSLLAGVFAIRAVRRDRLVDWVWAGLFLGFAFLAKYFAVLMGLAFAVYLLWFGGRRRITPILCILLGAAPGVAINVAWNFNHGWTNILFNVYTRNVEARFSALSPVLLVLLATVVLGGPGMVWFFLRPHCEGRRSWRETWDDLRRSGTLVAFFAIAVPGAVLLIVSLRNTVGLHWVVSFYPFVFLVLAARFDAVALRRQIRPMMIYTLGIATGILVLLSLPVELLKRHRSYNSIILGTHPREVLAQLAPYAADYTLTSPSYTQSGQLSFHSPKNVPVIGPGSHHGREDDFITDFRAFDGRNLMVLSARLPEAAATHPFFESVESREVEVHGARLALVLGRGFKYAAYRDAVLRPVAERYYRMPAWLAPYSRPAPFITRYGLESVVAP